MSDSDRLDRIERLLEETIQIVQSNAREIQSLKSVTDSNARSIQALTDSNARSIQALTDNVTDTNRQVAETNRQLVELALQVGRNMGSNEELSVLVTNMARILSDHVNDNQRHNQPAE